MMYCIEYNILELQMWRQKQDIFLTRYGYGLNWGLFADADVIAGFFCLHILLQMQTVSYTSQLYKVIQYALKDK